MNRIDATFARLRSEKRKALVIYATAGDPTAEESLAVFRAIAEAGADVLEVGVPFSDPTADGPVIQEASRRALSAGMSVAGALELVGELRKHTEIPVVLFGYANPFLQYGAKKFARAAKNAGVDGVLIVDLPPEEDDLLGPELESSGLHSIRLITPTSTDARMKRAARAGGGFLYYVSVTGVTGGQTGTPKAVRKSLRALRKHSDLPIVVGFGISEPAQARAISEIADGAVVGSAVVRKVGQGAQTVDTYVRSLRQAMDEASGD